MATLVIAGATVFDQFSCFELTEIMRQSNVDFQNALNDLADASSPMCASSIAFLKNAERKENELNIEPDKRIDLFSLNADVNAHNEAMIALVEGKSYIVSAIVSFMGDESKATKKKMKDALFERKDHTETLGMRL